MLPDGSDGDSDAEQRAMRRLMPCSDSDDCTTSGDDDDGAYDTHASVAQEASLLEVTVRPGVTLRVSHHAAKGIGHQLWPAAHVAAQYALLQSADLWRGARVLELGAGCGLTGLLVACLGAHVTLSDLPDVVDGPLAQNVAANEQLVAHCGGGSIRAAPLAWGDARHIADLGDNWDVLLCCDVVYRKHLFQPLVNTLRALAKPDKTLVVIAHLKRWSFEGDFWKSLARHFTPRQEVHVQAQPEAGQRRPVRVFTCRLK